MTSKAGDIVQGSTKMERVTQETALGPAGSHHWQMKALGLTQGAQSYWRGGSEVGTLPTKVKGCYLKAQFVDTGSHSVS